MNKKNNTKSVGSVRVRKSHGPKRHLFADYGSTLTYEFGKLGLLSKYSNIESFKLACIARGCKNPTKTMWGMFSILDTKAEKDEWLKNIKTNIRICREEDEKSSKKNPVIASTTKVEEVVA